MAASEAAPDRAGQREYHFSFGNSTDGPIGYCARVWAPTPEAAVETLKAALPWDTDVAYPHLKDEAGDITYVQVYLNPDAVTVGAIDEVDDEGPTAEPAYRVPRRRR